MRGRLETGRERRAQDRGWNVKAAFTRRLSLGSFRGYGDPRGGGCLSYTGLCHCSSHKTVSGGGCDLCSHDPALLRLKGESQTNPASLEGDQMSQPARPTIQSSCLQRACLDAPSHVILVGATGQGLSVEREWTEGSSGLPRSPSLASAGSSVASGEVSQRWWKRDWEKFPPVIDP